MRTKAAAIIIVGFIVAITFHFIAIADLHNGSNKTSLFSCPLTG
jgi:hypothetical protein